MIVQCTHCHGVYDEMDVTEIVARYADCDMYKAPCCGRTVDNRTWKGLPDMRRLEGEELRLVRRAMRRGDKSAMHLYEDGSYGQYRLTPKKAKARR